MRGRAIFIAALGLIVLCAGLLAARGLVVDEPPSEPREVQEARDAPAQPVPLAEPVPARLGRVRPVAPEVVALPQIPPSELQRVPPREDLSRFSQPLPPRPRNRGRIFRPFIDAAGRVAGSGLVVTIAGVVVTPPGKVCTDTDGQEWPCGVRARTAFRSFVRGRALACDLPEELTETSYTVACTLGGKDVGAWLVEQGWAEAAPGGPYPEEANAAREARRGIYGEAPSVTADMPEAAGALPPEDGDDPLAAN